MRPFLPSADQPGARWGLVAISGGHPMMRVSPAWFVTIIFFLSNVLKSLSLIEAIENAWESTPSDMILYGYADKLVIWQQPLTAEGARGLWTRLRPLTLVKMTAAVAMTVCSGKSLQRMTIAVDDRRSRGLSQWDDLNVATRWLLQRYCRWCRRSHKPLQPSAGSLPFNRLENICENVCPSQRRGVRASSISDCFFGDLKSHMSC